MSGDCVFCKIASGEIPSKGVYRDGDVLAIEDIHPEAPVHLLVMPSTHHPNIESLTGLQDGVLVAKLFEVASRLGRERGGADGFRLVINTGRNGGQTVDHLHVHVLAGRAMTWPPG
jgi:histidine triad (HIT) family protein